MKSMLVTGGAGFIGVNYIHHILRDTQYNGIVVNADKLTYAGNLESMAAISGEFGGERYFFEHIDICDAEAVQRVIEAYRVDTIVHFAAESHVDRSILGPDAFIETNIKGTFVLLEAARQLWGDREDVRFHHASTDEVYGSLGAEGLFYESTPYDPRSPYAASKASSDHIVRAYGYTYALPFTITNCSNNYGPFQFPEKLIPLMILNMLERSPLPVYGDGKNVRDWLYVKDHVTAIWLVLEQGRVGETYNIGGNEEHENIDLLHILCDEVARQTGTAVQKLHELITFVPDRKGHDRRYAICCEKITTELGWQPSVSLGAGIEHTVRWYLSNSTWIEKVRSGEYRQWITDNYEKRK